MVQSEYISEKEKGYEFDAYGYRKIWSGGFQNYSPIALFRTLEDFLKNQQLTQYYAQAIIDAFHMRFPNMGYNAKVIDAYNHSIIVPYSYGVEKAFFAYPQSAVIFGERNSGKTVTSWTLAWKLWNHLNQEAEIHTYGDIDNLTGALFDISKSSKISSELSKFINSIINHNEYETPGISEKPQIIIYNEMGEALLSKYANRTENIMLNLQAFRQRHTKRWIIYNVIRMTSLEAALRESSEIKIFKPLYGTLLENVLKNAPKAWIPIIRYVVNLKINEALVIYPLMTFGGGEAIELYEVSPPSWYWDTKAHAETNKRIAYGNETIPLKVLQEAAKLYKDEEIGWKKLAELMKEKYGYSKHPLWWRTAIISEDPSFQSNKKGRPKKKEEEEKE